MRLYSLTTVSAFIATGLASLSVTIDAGTLRGGDCGDGQNAVYYKGIPFAEPPVGDLRFEAPKAYSNKYTNGVLNATTPAATCIQFGEEMNPPGNRSEDCLYLDVWVPSNATENSKLPVKVWVYGGSDTSGGIEYPLYDGCNIAEKNSILVSINYRLGPLGFLALNSAGIYGNQGIQDILLGLKWVQESISAFGGDPNKVLLFGQSAGATDVYAIATLPEAPSLFNSAIVESIALPSLTTNSSLQNTSASFAQQLGCDFDDKSCLQSKSSDALVQAFYSDDYLNTGLGALDGTGVANRNTPKFWPYVDGAVINENPQSRGIQVPTIFGYNQQEGMMDTLTKYNTEVVIENLTASDYTSFLEGNWGSAAQMVEKYYPLSLFESATGSTPLGVLEAIAHVLTDAHFKCPGYQCAVQAVRNNMPAWVYEFTHNSTCAWLDTIEQDDTILSLMGAAHTAELPYVFGNLNFDFPANGTNCTGSQAEYGLSREMISLWTAMAENAVPLTGDIQWPQFNITSTGADTPGMIFGNSSTPGNIDFSPCALWAQIDSILDGSNATATGTQSSNGSGNPTASSTGVLPTSGTMIVSPIFGGSVILAVLSIAAAVFA